MDQEIRFDLSRGAQSELLVSAVHRIARLKRNYAAPAETRKFGAQVGRGQTEGTKIVMSGKLNAI
jgi:hypothetical protein